MILLNSPSEGTHSTGTQLILSPHTRCFGLQQFSIMQPAMRNKEIIICTHILFGQAINLIKKFFQFIPPVICHSKPNSLVLNFLSDSRMPRFIIFISLSQDFQLRCEENYFHGFRLLCFRKKKKKKLFMITITLDTCPSPIQYVQTSFQISSHFLQNVAIRCTTIIKQSFYFEMFKHVQLSFLTRKHPLLKPE